ncbi:nucleotide exchange factor SIL1 [Colletotrichum tofieldiae]|uniref:Nucleotide exchange factor SIL1 n=1 Tax=Colletotrichum tofieldiae TaxID=708197 RepID=A0A166M5M8_9PEZI|nr:nucleotide exchange factor SIL1 [Colletotrichum tofieldiae]GKT63469.1 nucleotide exchange factor SIL1 [Colletotrichum tofieldiae]GKT72521.1 nucleotide exchange factor SIL1 [Colletotrichum tofieldiae]GKT89647.1 nucleotide exchange factor SIL1 [Colletotrichum tofieldiae]
MAPKNPTRLSLLPFTIFMVVFGLVSLASSTSASAAPVVASPSAEVELICHTDNPAECYPKIFQPTEEFQIVHDDQELPHGLHIRMNINTGQKEAKINDPDEKSSALEGLPVDRSIVVVDSDKAPEVDVPKDAPKYDPVGMVKQPQQESGEFYTNLEFVKKGAHGSNLPLDEALEFLEDISHDIYYGLKITETFDTVRSLLCLMVDPKTPTPSEGAVPRDQQAAAIISGALQNNPTALEEVTKVWPQLMDASCRSPHKAPELKLRDGFYASFVPAPEDTDHDVLRAANKAKAQVAAIKGLIKSPAIRDDFIANKGMDRILEVLGPRDAQWETAQRKAGQFVLDSFLDENMGADVGVWPLFKASEADRSKRIADRVSDENWKVAVKSIMEKNRGDKTHWSRDLYDRLDAHEKAQLKVIGKEEL